MTSELDVEFEKFVSQPIGEISYLMFDAIYLKVRHDKSVIDMAILLAYGVTPEGKREILGALAKLSKAEVHWREFLQDLQSRGLRGLRLIISDNHAEMKAARTAVESKCSELCPKTLYET